MPDKMIYLDNASTTFPYKEIIDSFYKFLSTYPGNSSSIHKLGQTSKRVIEKSKDIILKNLALNDYNVIFTSGATEANNLAILGISKAYCNRGKHIIVSEIEHPSILEATKELEKEGFRVTYLPVNEHGIVEPETLEKAIDNETILVSIMAVNNEVGSINDIAKLSAIVHRYPKAYFHVDAVQALGKINFDYTGIDLITFSGHKIHGLIGCGCLLKKSKINISPIIYGGGQQEGLRSGTESLPLFASLALAIKDARENENIAFKNVLPLAEKLVNYLSENKDFYELNSDYKNNPFIINFSLKNKKASVVVEALSEQNIFVSSLSACHSRKEKYSYVVKAIKHDEKLAHNTIRVSFSRFNTMDDVETLILHLDRIIKSIKQ